MRTDLSDRAQVVALPPLILAAALALGFLLDFLWPARFLPRVYALPAGLFLIILAIALSVSAAREMSRAKTAVDIRKPTTEIVTSGVYEMSRNPIYLGMALLCVGVGFAADSLWFLALSAPLAVILQKGVIEAEEIYLEAKFGEKYLRYKARVRRWI